MAVWARAPAFVPEPPVRPQAGPEGIGVCQVLRTSGSGYINSEFVCQPLTPFDTVRAFQAFNLWKLRRSATPLINIPSVTTPNVPGSGTTGPPSVSFTNPMRVWTWAPVPTAVL